MSETIHAVLAGGGTAGHVNPLLSTAIALQGRGVEVSAVGTPEGLETDLVPAAGIELDTIEKVPFPRRPNGAMLAFPSRFRAAVSHADEILTNRNADVMVGFGGFVSTPMYLAARRRGIPVIIHEQNAKQGLANRYGARFAKVVALTFPSTSLKARDGETVAIGLPLRPAIAELAWERLTDPRGARVNAAQKLGLDPDKTTLVVTGGVQLHLLGLGVVAHEDQADDQGDHDDRQHHHEQVVPAPVLQDEPGDRGAQRGGGRDDHAHQAHHQAACRDRHEREDRGHQQGQHHRGAGGLDHAGSQEHGEGRGGHSDRGADQEQRRRGDEHGAHRQSRLHEEAGGGDDDGHREHEARGEPLGGDRGDRQVRHQGGQRDGQQGLVEDHHERGDDQDRDDRGDLVGGGRAAVLHRGAGVVGSVAGGVLGVGGGGAAGDDAGCIDGGELARGLTGGGHRGGMLSASRDRGAGTRTSARAMGRSSQVTIRWGRRAVPATRTSLSGAHVSP